MNMAWSSLRDRRSAHARTRYTDRASANMPPCSLFIRSARHRLRRSKSHGQWTCHYVKSAGIATRVCNEAEHLSQGVLFSHTLKFATEIPTGVLVFDDKPGVSHDPRISHTGAIDAPQRTREETNLRKFTLSIALAVACLTSSCSGDHS